MLKKEKIYRLINTIGFCLHICSFLIVLFASFLPFRESQNFYEVFTGFFSTKFCEIQPFLVLLVLFLNCVGAFFALKRPWFWVGVLISSFAFYVIVSLPISIEALFVGFTSKWIASSMSNYGIGFKLIMGVSNIWYLDIVLVIYSAFIFFTKERTARD